MENPLKSYGFIMFLLFCSPYIFYFMCVSVTVCPSDRAKHIIKNEKLSRP